MMSHIICPFCLKEHDFEKSQKCDTRDQIVPRSYLQSYRDVPPLWLLTVGFTQHGKTTYLAALTAVLEEIIRIWDRAYPRALDQFTQNAIRDMRKEAAEGRMAEQTPNEFRRPLFYQVNNIPEYGSRCLVMYDAPGQVFDGLTRVEESAPAIRHATTTWFLVSLSDLHEDSQGRSLYELFQSYISGLERLQVDFADRNLIVVFTKGDLLQNKLFKDHLIADPLSGLCTGTIPDDFDMEEYVGSMEEMSSLLKDYTRQHVPGGTAFVNMVEGYEMKLEFCVTSALGSDSRSSHAREKPVRYRIIDPFIWALKLEAPSSARESY